MAFQARADGGGEGRKGDKGGKGKGGGKGGGKASDGKSGDGGGKGKKGVCLQFLRGSCSRAATGCAFSRDVKQAQRVVNAVYAGATSLAVVQPAPQAAAPAPGADPAGAGGASVAQVAPVALTLSKGAGRTFIWARPVG